MLMISSFTLLASEATLEVDIMELRGRIKKVENNLVDLEVQKKLLEIEKERLAGELNNRIDLTLKNGLLTKRIKVEKDLKDKVDKNEEGVRDWKHWKNVVLGIGGSSIIALIIFYLFLIFKKIPSEVGNKINSSIQNEIKKKSKDIANVLLTEFREQTLLETSLKIDKKIIVAYKDERDNKFIRKLLTSPKYGFKNVNFIKFNEAIPEETNLLILNNINLEYAENSLADWIKSINKNATAYLNFVTCQNRSKLKELISDEKINTKVNFSNSNITLYNQIMSSLKYQDLISKN